MTADELDAVREVVHAELKASRSIKLNGDPVAEWFFGKVLTAKDIIYLVCAGIALVYTLGGKAVLITTDTAMAVKAAAAATQATDELGMKVDDLIDYVMSQSAARTEENQATRAIVVALEQRVTATVTRGELRTTVQQEILPRLQRIEAEQKKVATELAK